MIKVVLLEPLKDGDFKENKEPSKVLKPVKKGFFAACCCCLGKEAVYLNGNN